MGFPRHEDFFNVVAATWMKKIIYNLEPEIITDYVRHPTYCAACKVAPKIKPKSTRFKRTAVASGITNYNKFSKTMASLNPKKCKAVIQMLKKMGDVPEPKMLSGKINPPKILAKLNL